MKKYNFNWYKRKIIWILNVFLSVVLFIVMPFRKKNVWVFGCWEGKRYDDNSRYLFEYVNENNKEIRCIWISRNTEVVESLSKKGYEVYTANSWKGIASMLLAGVSFYTNGMDDLSDLCWIKGSLVVCLNHGNTGIKKAAFTLDKFKKDSLVKTIKLLRDKLFNYYYYDVCITTSPMSSDLFEELYGDHDKKKYVIAGMPRNDILRHRELFDVKVPEIIDEACKYILYLPTYREYKNSVIKDLMERMMDDRDIVSLFEKWNIRFLVKPHNIDETSEKLERTSQYFKFVNSQDVESTQVLMAFADCVITDYSSCGIDFAMTGKPVFIYVPDFEEYNKDNGFRDMWNSFYLEHPEYKDYEYLKNEIINYFDKNLFNSGANEWINNIYLDKNLSDSVYSQNVLEVISKKMGI